MSIQTNNSILHRIINREVMENNLDPVCYSEALRICQGGSSSSIMKCYFALRIKALKAMGVDLSQAHQAVSMRTIEQCGKRISSRCHSKEKQNHQEATKVVEGLEGWLGNFVLLVASSSASLCFLTYAGKAFSLKNTIVLLAGVILIQSLPWLITKLIKVPYLTMVSLFCIILSVTSFGAGMLLMRDNPEKVIVKATENTAVTMIQITPAAPGAEVEKTLPPEMNQELTQLNLNN